MKMQCNHKKSKSSHSPPTKAHVSWDQQSTSKLSSLSLSSAKWNVSMSCIITIHSHVHVNTWSPSTQTKHTAYSLSDADVLRRYLITVHSNQTHCLLIIKSWCAIILIPSCLFRHSFCLCIIFCEPVRLLLGPCGLPRGSLGLAGLMSVLGTLPERRELIWNRELRTWLIWSTHAKLISTKWWRLKNMLTLLPFLLMLGLHTLSNISDSLLRMIPDYMPGYLIAIRHWAINFVLD